MKFPLCTRRRTAGFTLVELMIATSITGVLASVAYPSFSGALLKVRRTEAMVAMLQLQQAQERWRSGSRRYGTLAEVGVPSAVPGRNYLLSVAEPSVYRLPGHRPGHGHAGTGPRLPLPAPRHRVRQRQLPLRRDRGSCEQRAGESQMLEPVNREAQRGLTLVELLVGLALGLLVVASGTLLLTTHLREHRALLLEARLMQDLRTATDLVARDLRRAGHWGAAAAGVWSPAEAPRANPYAALAPAGAASDAASFAYSRDSEREPRARRERAVRLSPAQQGDRDPARQRQLAGADRRDAARHHDVRRSRRRCRRSTSAHCAANPAPRPARPARPASRFAAWQCRSAATRSPMPPSCAACRRSCACATTRSSVPARLDEGAPP